MNRKVETANKILSEYVDKINNAAKELNIESFKLKKFDELILKLSKEINNLQIKASNKAIAAKQNFLKSTAFAAPQCIEQALVMPDCSFILETSSSSIFDIKIPKIEIKASLPYPELSAPLELSLSKSEVIEEVKILIELALKEKTLSLLRLTQKEIVLKIEFIKNSILDLESKINLQQHIIKSCL